MFEKVLKVWERVRVRMIMMMIMTIESRTRCFPQWQDQVIFKRPLLPAYPLRTVAEPTKTRSCQDAAEAFVAGAVSLGCIPS